VRRALLALALALLISTVGLAAERQTLANGLRVLVTSDLNAGVMTAEVLLPISVEEEAEEKQGIRYLTQRMLLRGATTESGDAMAEKLAQKLLGKT
jgi:predicted Zn-dependent peptidase